MARLARGTAHAALQVMNGLPLTGQRFVVLAPDMPWPPNRGGRADVWRRLCALRSQGAEVFLVHIYLPCERMAPTEQHWHELIAQVDRHMAFPMRKGVALTLRRLAQAPCLPWHAATRVLLPEEQTALISAVADFAPTAIWLEGPWFGVLARVLKSRFRLPILYRSHNIEFQYLRKQAFVAASPRDRIAWRLACVGLERFEWGLLQEADAVFDISMDDLAYWQSRGLKRGFWLPPLPEAAIGEPSEDKYPCDLVFSGNLRTPNNLLGLNWLLEEVMPQVLAVDPSASLTVVGSGPDVLLRQRLLSLPYVATHFDVPSVNPYLHGARALLNPVFVGSGVQLKTLDMLSTATPIVTRSQGLRGLPSELARVVHVANTAVDFAAAILRARAHPDCWRDERARFRHHFSAQGVAERIATVLHDNPGGDGTS